jgi:hypothetical protein
MTAFLPLELTRNGLSETVLPEADLQMDLLADGFSWILFIIAFAAVKPIFGG